MCNRCAGQASGAMYTKTLKKEGEEETQNWAKIGCCVPIKKKEKRSARNKTKKVSKEKLQVNVSVHKNGEG